MPTIPFPLRLAGGVFAATLALPRAVADDVATAIAATRPTLDLRARYENVDDDAFARDAEAFTVRARVGLTTGSWRGWRAFVEAEGVAAPGADRYNSTANGVSDRPVVADPTGEEWNQAWIAWTPRDGSELMLGRQRVILDNQRWFGNVGFRQNEQTFDAVRLASTHGPWTLRYAWLDEVHRIFGDDHPNPLSAEQSLDAHLVHVSRAIGGSTLVGYAHFVENQDLPLTSARTLGLRWTGKRKLAGEWTLQGVAEFAVQDDWRDGADVIDADYRSGEVAVSRGGWSARAGREVLGGDGTYALQTPFATLHAFNGWTDRFLVTPADGLVDTWLAASAPLGRGSVALVWHDFRSDQDARPYGHEWGASYRTGFGEHLELELKAADYTSEGFASDTTKLWAALSVRY